MAAKVEDVAATSGTGDLEDQAKKTRRSSSKRHSFYSAIPLTRRMQEGAWGKFQERGRRSLERLQNRVSSRFMGRPLNLYIAITGVFFAIIITIIYVEVISGHNGVMPRNNYCWTWPPPLRVLYNANGAMCRFNTYFKRC
uniref:Uncharacterized protein n=1 Tax=Ciona savignyi TaxID=51511 RepID=H2YHP2_CIOSA